MKYLAIALVFAWTTQIHTEYRPVIFTYLEHMPIVGKPLNRLMDNHTEKVVAGASLIAVVFLCAGAVLKFQERL